MDMSVLQKRVLPELSTRYFGGNWMALIIRLALSRRDQSREQSTHLILTLVDRDLAAADATMNIFDPPLAGPGANRFRSNFSDRNSLRSSEWHSFYGPVWFPVIRIRLPT